MAVLAVALVAAVVTALATGAAGLSAGQSLAAFFGLLRRGVDHRVLFEHERAIAHTFPEFAPLGFLSYFDFGPEHGRYGNLILFATPEVPEAWHRGPAHRAAVADAPRHYHHIRLHKGRIAGPLTGDGVIEVQRTQYLDFDDPRPWRGLRSYQTTER